MAVNTIQETEEKAKIGANLKRLMKDKGLSMTKVAESLHVSHSTISRWADGKGGINVMMVERLADALECSTAELLKGSGYRLSPEKIAPVSGLDPYENFKSFVVMAAVARAQSREMERAECEIAEILALLNSHLGRIVLYGQHPAHYEALLGISPIPAELDSIEKRKRNLELIRESAVKIEFFTELALKEYKKRGTIESFYSVSPET